MKAHRVLTMSILFLFSAVTLYSQATEDSTRYLARPMPQRWTFSESMTQTLPTDDNWWKAFEDPILDSLITIGVNNNYNLSEAAHRREIARLTMKQAQSGYYPTVGVSGGFTRTYNNKTAHNEYSITADVNWEIDLFGKITSKVKASRAGYKASLADYTATMVSITSDIVTYYIDYRVLQNRIAVTQEHICYQDTVANKAQARFDAGLVSKLDVAQSKTVYYSTEAMLPALRAQKARTLNALAVLLSLYPSELEPMLTTSMKLPSYSHLIPTGIPADLLRRRPDIVAAEATLAQYAAEIGVAKKDFLPTLSLNGSIGWGGTHINGDNSNGLTYTIAPQLSWTIFDGMARKYAVAQAREQLQLGINQYNIAIITAYTEVENAMQAYQSALNTLKLDQDVLNQSHEAFLLSMDQYTQGLSPFTNVVNAQIDWLNYANALVIAHGDALTSLVNLYKALGGSPLPY